MRLLNWLGQKSETKDSTWGTFRAFWAAAATGGPNTALDALKITTVFACARVYANGLAQIPLKLMLELAAGGARPAKEHPLYQLLALRPNEWQTSFLFRQTIGLHLAMANNAYVFKVYVGEKLVELLPFSPDVVAVKQNPDRSLNYRVRLHDGSFMDVGQANMWHLRNMSWDGVSGLDAVQMARNAIGLADSAEEHGKKFYANGARVSGLLTTDGSLDPKQVDALRESWNATYGGATNAGKTAILYGGLKYQAMGMPADASQYNETRRTQVEEICRGFGVMPIMVGFSDKAATYASAEAMFQAHVTNTMMPVYENFCQSAMVNLLTKRELEDGYYFHLFANALLRGNTDARGQFYMRMWQTGAMNANEIRALEDTNPYPGGEKYFVPLNYRTTDAPQPPPAAS